MRLTELEPQFLVRSGDTWRDVDSINCDGIMFLCPTCFLKNGGPVGTHVFVCWRPHVPDDVTPRPGRWEFQGTGYVDFSLQPGPKSGGQRSVKIEGGCNAHFYITNGEVTFT